MRVVWLGLYLGMIVGGILTLILQLLYSPVVTFEYAAGSGVVAVSGAYLLWEDFLR